MKIALSILGGLVVLVVAFVVWRYIAFIRSSRRHMAALWAPVAPIIDAIQDGGQVPRDQIEQMVPSTVSIMPKGLDANLSEQELADLVAYLMTLGKRP